MFHCSQRLINQAQSPCSHQGLVLQRPLLLGLLRTEPFYPCGCCPHLTAILVDDRLALPREEEGLGRFPVLAPSLNLPIHFPEST